MMIIQRRPRIASHSQEWKVFDSILRIGASTSVGKQRELDVRKRLTLIFTGKRVQHALRVLLQNWWMKLRRKHIKANVI
jgi:hypothetical protein